MTTKTHTFLDKAEKARKMPAVSTRELVQCYGSIQKHRSSVPLLANSVKAKPILAIIDSVNMALEQSNPEIAQDIMAGGVLLDE